MTMTTGVPVSRLPFYLIPLAENARPVYNRMIE